MPGPKSSHNLIKKEKEEGGGGREGGVREGGKVEGRKERRKDLKKKYSNQTSKCEPFPGKGKELACPHHVPGTLPTSTPSVESSQLHSKMDTIIASEWFGKQRGYATFPPSHSSYLEERRFEASSGCSPLPHGTLLLPRLPPAQPLCSPACRSCSLISQN